jgi:hypothetical protein
VIVDYKTGRWRQQAESIDDSLPLSLYAMAVSGRMGRDVSRIRLHHLASGDRAETVRDAERLAADWKSLIDVADEMRSQPEFPATPGPLCRWCDFLQVCEEGRAEVGRAAAPAAPAPEPIEE